MCVTITMILPNWIFFLRSVLIASSTFYWFFFSSFSHRVSVLCDSIDFARQLDRVLIVFLSHFFLLCVRKNMRCVTVASPVIPLNRINRFGQFGLCVSSCIMYSIRTINVILITFMAFIYTSHQIDYIAHLLGAVSMPEFCL